ncbi:hypothetical protein EDD15DRAFT_2361143 [Pisolithus albus]|nr:hypothetical protein EDD15DRAFT_2361143 [Pisolithus albus]
MADTEYYWALIGSDGSAHVYGSDDCPFIACGRQSPALPLTIQCKSSAEARRVARTLQPIADSLPRGADHTQILAAFDIPPVRTLLEDEASFYAIVIGSPPSIHRTAESAARAEGSFRYRIRRQTTSFWTALAFMIVKGIAQRMPPMLTYNEIGENPTQSGVDSLADQLRHSLTVSSQTSPTISTPSRTSLPSPSPGSSFLTSSASQRSSALPSTSPSSSEAVVSPIIYSHVRNLRGVISSNYYPTSTARIRHLARPLGDLAARYLASHGYGSEAVDRIIEAHRRAHSNEELITFLAGQGMSVNEAKFLLVLVDLRDTVPR